MLSRRGFLAGLATALAAPAIVRTPGLLMPVRALPEEGFSIRYVGPDFEALAAEIMNKGFARIDFGFVTVKPEAVALADGRAIYNHLRLIGA